MRDALIPAAVRDMPIPRCVGGEMNLYGMENYAFLLCVEKWHTTSGVLVVIFVYTFEFITLSSKSTSNKTH